MSYLDGVLARAGEAVAVVQPRPKSRFEEASLLEAGQFPAGGEAPPSPAARSAPAAEPPDRAGSRPPVGPERGPGPAEERARAAAAPRPEPLPTAEGAERIVERLTVVDRSAVPRERAETPAPGPSPPSAPVPPSPADPRREPARAAGAAPGAAAAPPPPPSVERRIESVLRSVTETVERETVVEGRVRENPEGGTETPRRPAEARPPSPPVGVTTAEPPRPPRPPAPSQAAVVAALAAAHAPSPPAEAPGPAPPFAREEPRPVVHVTIGQVEIRAGAPPRTPAQPARRPPAQPELTLEEYLRERNGGAP